MKLAQQQEYLMETYSKSHFIVDKTEDFHEIDRFYFCYFNRQQISNELSFILRLIYSQDIVFTYSVIIKSLRNYSIANVKSVSISMSSQVNVNTLQFLPLITTFRALVSTDSDVNFVMF